MTTYPGYRRFWLALRRTHCIIRNLAAQNAVISLFTLNDGDGLILPEPYLRIDWGTDGELVPIGTHATLSARSREIRSLRLRRGGTLPPPPVVVGLSSIDFQWTPKRHD